MRAAFKRGRGGCVRRTVRLGLGGGDLANVLRVQFRLGRLVIRDGVAPFKATITRARLRRGRLNRIRIIPTMRDGRRIRLARTVRSCR